MSYGKSLATIKSAFKTASPIVKQTTAAYTNGDSLADVQDKAANVVGEEVVAGYGDSLSTVKDKAPVAGQSIDIIVEPTFADNVVTIPQQAGVVYVNADTYDLESDPVVIDVLTEDVELDYALVTSLNVLAVPDEDYAFLDGLTTQWAFTYEPESVEAIDEPTVADNVVTIPVQTGVTYVNGDTYDPEPEEGEPVVDVLTGTVTLDDTTVTSLSVLAVPTNGGYVFGENAVTSWTFDYVEPEA